MRTKALVLGALPKKLRGPWVGLTEGIEWEAHPREDYHEQVGVQVDHEDAPIRLLNGEPLKVKGNRVRVLIFDGAENLEVKTITVQVKQVA